MLTKSEKNLIDVLAKYDLGEELAMTLPSGLSDDQMDILAEYICEKMESNEELTRSDIVRASLILRGLIEVEDDDE